MHFIHNDPADSRDKLLILAGICLSALVLPLSFTGGAVATPAIGRELGGDPVTLTWITNAFMLTFGSLLMGAGALADVYGRKRVFAIGMVLFTLISLAQACASTAFWLDIFRGLQGVAGAAALAGGSAALAQEFEGHARTRAFSLLGTTFGIGLAFGPLVAGALIDAFSWRAIFGFTALIGAIALIFGIPRMRETRDPNAAGLDWPGTATFSITLALFTFGVIAAPDSGWKSPLVISLLAASVVFGAVFIVIELRTRHPMLDLRLFRYPRFLGVQMLPLGTCYCYIVLVVMLPLRFIGVEGLSELEAGWLMVALSLPMLVVPIAVTMLTRWAPSGVLCGIGFLIAAGGLYWLSRYNVGDPRSALVWPMLLIGTGAGMPWGLMDGLSVSVVPKERAGMAAGIFNTARVAGEGITLAIVTAVLAALVQGHLLVNLPDAREIAPETLAAASQYITTGGMAHATTLLPNDASSVLGMSYAEAFRSLLHILAGVTLCAAAVAFFLLGRAGRDAEDTARVPELREPA
jgi:MFS family permease